MLDRNSVLTLMEECFWDEIETFTIECVSELGTDELEIIFTDYLVDYASLDEIEELKITDMEIECDDGVETVSGEMRLDILVEGYAHWDGSEEYLGTHVRWICSWYCKQNMVVVITLRSRYASLVLRERIRTHLSQLVSAH